MIYKPFVKNTHKHAFVWKVSRPLQTYLERAYKSQTKKTWLMQTITVKDAALFNSNLSASFQKKVAEEENYSPLSKYQWSA